jgi:hypothetical protein
MVQLLQGVGGGGHGRWSTDMDGWRRRRAVVLSAQVYGRRHAAEAVRGHARPGGCAGVPCRSAAAREQETDTHNDGALGCRRPSHLDSCAWNSCMVMIGAGGLAAPVALRPLAGLLNKGCTGCAPPGAGSAASFAAAAGFADVRPALPSWGRRGSFCAAGGAAASSASVLYQSST